MTTEFLITSFLVVVSPGTGVLYTVATGLSRGGRASVVAAAGCTLGIVPHMLAAITGAAALFHTSALAFEALKAAGVAYLLWMAWSTLRSGGALTLDRDRTERRARAVIASGILVNLFNPKLSIFFFAFLPQFVGAADPEPLAHMLSLSGVFMAMTFAVFVVYGIFAAALRRRVLERPSVLKVMRIGFAAAFVGLGLRLALAERT